MNLRAATPMNVLLVDDDPGDALLVCEAFARAKVSNEVVVVSDGEQAMQHLRDPALRVPDLVLLDLNLPRKHGREVLAEIRSDAALTHLPVVILSTSEAESDIRTSYELHANAYVSKPTDLRRFVEVLREIDAFFSLVKLPGRAGGVG